jgi:DNA-binding transcriptional ArsR family regulator
MKGADSTRRGARNATERLRSLGAPRMGTFVSPTLRVGVHGRLCCPATTAVARTPAMATQQPISPGLSCDWLVTEHTRIQTMGRDQLESEEQPALQDVLDTLDDPACRAVISCLDDPMTAKELATDCDIPLSTMYRKLDLLTEASLVREQAAIREDGQHTTRYALAFEEINVSLDEDRSIEVQIKRTKASPNERLSELWSEVRRET